MTTRLLTLLLMSTFAFGVAASVTGCSTERSLGTNSGTGGGAAGQGATGTGGGAGHAAAGTGGGAAGQAAAGTGGGAAGQAGGGATAGIGGAAAGGAAGTSTPPPVDAGVTDAGPLALKLYSTCGDPVCRGYQGDSGVPLCTTEKMGDPCTVNGQKCDPQSACNAFVVCATSDPKLQPAGCPESRRNLKNDIHYLSPAELARYRDELLAMKLATWRYKHDPIQKRLGFMIDDNEGSAAVDSQRDIVDLYGYTSMAVATIQLQAHQIETLQKQIADLQKTLARRSR